MARDADGEALSREQAEALKATMEQLARELRRLENNFEVLKRVGEEMKTEGGKNNGDY